MAVRGKHVPFVILLIFGTVTLGQDEQKRIGSIEFYGYSGLNLETIRAALPLHEGDIYPGPQETINALQKAVNVAIGSPPTHVSPVCCDKYGRYVIFIGLPGDSIKPTTYNPVPTGHVRLPAQIITLYQQTMDALSESVLKGNAQQDNSKGYALSTAYAPLRAKQLAARKYALHHEQLVRQVLDSSNDPHQRVVAAHMLGYARQSNHQIAALVRASHDSNEDVRNNATRALGVLAQSNPRVAAQIPAAGFIEMLNSGSWTDRNKAGWVLESLTISRDPKLLNQLRSQALVSLIEMARWRSTGHAQSARILLGRIAGIEESRLVQLASEDEAEKIINALPKKP